MTTLPGDARPAFRAFSAAPADGSIAGVQIDVFGGWLQSNYVYTFAELEGGGGVHARYARGRFVVDARVAGGTSTETVSLGAVPRQPVFATDAVVRVGIAMVDQPSFRLVLSIGGGTTLEAGASLWWRLGDGRFVLDFAANVAGRRRFLGRSSSWSQVQTESLQLAPERMMPELGLAVTTRPDGAHALRLGHYGAVPTIGYRYSDEAFALEASAGWILFGAVATLGLGVPF